MVRSEFESARGVKKTESGLLYQVMTPAEGDKSKETDTVQVHYKGTLTDGTQLTVHMIVVNQRLSL